jgi:2-polyprenyl-3-methyl-5-hydroxy-6-metoxy-1,4-benzoquinol methylase
VAATAAHAHADLFRLLGDEDRLRLLALCDAEELTVGELSTLLRQSQPQVTRKTQPLRDAGLLSERRDGTRILLRADAKDNPIVLAALRAGHDLCLAEGRLARIPKIVARREETARKLFADGGTEISALPTISVEPFLPLLSPLLPGRHLAVDVGCGDGLLLPLLSPLYDRVIAVDRSAARLASAAARVARSGLPNVRLRQAEMDDSNLAQEIAHVGGADLVTIVRVLQFIARPSDVITTAAHFLRPGGHLIVADHVPHKDESLREQGHVWLGFEPDKLRAWLSQAGLEVVTVAPLPGAFTPALQLIVGKRIANP